MEFYCRDCGDDWCTDKEETTCTQCNSTNIIKTAD